MSTNAPQPPDINVWQAQYLRCISFPVRPQHFVAQNWWQEVTGTERDSRTEKKREIEETGTLEGVTVSLSVDLLRVQWTVKPQLTTELVPDGVPVLGPFVAWRTWFRNLMHRWFPLAPEVRRLAFAGVLLQPVGTRKEGYELLDRYLRSLELDPESSDLLYRINRRVRSQSGIADLTINRLMTWSVGQFEGIIRAQLLGDLGQPESGYVERVQRYTCVLELDVNTVPEPRDRVLPSESLPAVFDELLELGAEIAAKGDHRI